VWCVCGVCECVCECGMCVWCVCVVCVCECVCVCVCVVCVGEHYPLTAPQGGLWLGSPPHLHGWPTPLNPWVLSLRVPQYDTHL